jgi:putative flippase GtrA
MAFLRYLFMGAIGTLVHYAVLIVLVERARVTPTIGTTCGFVAGAFVNYLLNYRFTFRSRRSHRDAMPKFMTLAAAGAVVNGSIVSLGAGPLRLPYLIPQVVATGVVVVGTFLGNRVWTFGRRPHD